MTNIEKFMRWVYPEPNTGCWLWGGCANPKSGYGAITDKKNNLTIAHRKSYLLFKGNFDRNLHVLHTCDVRLCVNPDHLFLGTNKQNIDDKVKKNRQARGESHGNTKLKSEDILMIRNKKSQGVSSPEIGKIFGITRQQVNRIVVKKWWSHI